MKRLIYHYAASLLICGLIIISSLSAVAQPRDLTSTNKKAIRYYLEGQSAHNMRKSEEAELSFRLAIDADPQFVEAYTMLAFVYGSQGKTEKAIDNFRKAVEVNPDFYPDNFFTLAQLELELGRYEDAAGHFKKYLTYPNINREYELVARSGINQCEFAKEAVKNPVPFNPINMGPQINSELDEYFPCITADNLMFLYTRQLLSQNTPSGFNEDFYVSGKKGDQWVPSANIGLPINTWNNEGAPTLSVDGQILVFTACPIFDNYGPERKGFGSCDLFVTQRIGDKWTKPVNIGPPINTSNWETQPSLAADGRTLYFVRGTSTRSGIKDQDIYVTQIDDEGRWSEPKPLNNNVNSKLREESVFIHPDGNTIYFASDGHPGMGGLDIFMSKKDANGEWGPAQNLGYPINTHHNENSLLVDAQGKYGYFASNRDGGQGGLDLYYFDLPKHAKPDAVTYVKGRVYDSKTKQPLYSKFELIDLETGKLAIESWSNKGNGEFLVSLPSNKDYALNVSHDGYLFYSENFALKGGADVTNPYHKDVPLQPIEVGEKVVLKNIFFETDKYDLKPASQVELKKLIDFLNKNKNVKIEISGHTDNVGTDDYNNKLSHNRAKAVYDYLVANSIEASRLSYKGYGETQPIASNDTEAGRAENRRTEFKITGKN